MAERLLIGHAVAVGVRPAKPIVFKPPSAVFRPSLVPGAIAERLYLLRLSAGPARKEEHDSHHQTEKHRRPHQAVKQIPPSDPRLSGALLAGTVFYAPDNGQAAVLQHIPLISAGLVHQLYINFIDERHIREIPVQVMDKIIRVIEADRLRPVNTVPVLPQPVREHFQKLRLPARCAKMLGVRQAAPLLQACFQLAGITVDILSRPLVELLHLLQKQLRVPGVILFQPPGDQFVQLLVVWRGEMDGRGRPGAFSRLFLSLSRRALKARSSGFPLFSGLPSRPFLASSSGRPLPSRLPLRQLQRQPVRLVKPPELLRLLFRVAQTAFLRVRPLDGPPVVCGLYFQFIPDPKDCHQTSPSSFRSI